MVVNDRILHELKEILNDILGIRAFFVFEDIAGIYGFNDFGFGERMHDFVFSSHIGMFIGMPHRTDIGGLGQPGTAGALHTGLAEMGGWIFQTDGLSLRGYMAAAAMRPLRRCPDAGETWSGLMRREHGPEAAGPRSSETACRLLPCGARVRREARPEPKETGFSQSFLEMRRETIDYLILWNVNSWYMFQTQQTGSITMKKLLSLAVAAMLALPLVAASMAGAESPDVRCVKCGSTSYGSKCPRRTDGGPHMHGPNSSHNKCVYCGTSKIQASGKCKFGPSGAHAF